MFTYVHVQTLFHVAHSFWFRQGICSLVKLTINYPARKGVESIHLLVFFFPISICHKYLLSHFCPREIISKIFSSLCLCVWQKCFQTMDCCWHSLCGEFLSKFSLTWLESTKPFQRLWSYQKTQKTWSFVLSLPIVSYLW